MLFNNIKPPYYTALVKCQYKHSDLSTKIVG